MNIIKIQCTKFSKNSKKIKVMTNGIQCFLYKVYLLACIVQFLTYTEET